MSLKLETHFCGKVFIIHCAGRIMAGQETVTLETALNDAQHEFAFIVLNLNEVTRLDSTGLGLLVRQTARLNKRGGTIRLAGAQPFVAHLLSITKLAGFLQSYPTEEEAIRSFATPRSTNRPDSPGGLRLLVFDPSADLCSFIKAVLTPHGFDVRTTCSFRDAKTLVRVDEVDCILAGPGTPQLSAEAASRELSAISPKASALWLDADFKSREASAATEALLQMFGVNSGSPIPEPCP